MLMPEEREDLKIVAAAIKVGDQVYVSRRHGAIMQKIWEKQSKLRISQEMQGFVASDGKFYTRFQAGSIAFTAGQTKARKQSLLRSKV